MDKDVSICQIYVFNGIYAVDPVKFFFLNNLNLYIRKFIENKAWSLGLQIITLNLISYHRVLITINKQLVA